MEKIKITCEGAKQLPLSKLKPLQGKLKTLPDMSYQSLKKEILETGFSEPIAVWVNEGKNFILNGHQRLSTLKKMKKEGYDIPDIPVSLVEAKDEIEAKRKILSLTSQFGVMTSESLYDFIKGTPLDDINTMEGFRFPDIDQDEFFAKHFPDISNKKEYDESKDDVVPEVDKIDVKVKTGDIWLLGAYWFCESCGKRYQYEEGKKMKDCPCG